MVIASTPRLLIGEGSFTSGYGDGPVAGLLAALIWLLWRSDHAAMRGWLPLLTIVGAALAATKQEGAMAVLVAAVVCARYGRDVASLWIAGPAMALAARLAGMDHERGRAGRHGLRVARHRHVSGAARADRDGLPVRVREYTYMGTFVAGPAILILLRRRTLPGPEMIILIIVSAVSALAFVCSDWQDVSMHLHVTVPRLIAAMVPSMVVACFGAGSPRARGLKSPKRRLLAPDR